MAAEGTREFDFTWTVRLAAVAVGLVLATWLGTAVWTPTDLPRWLVLVGAVAIALGIAGYARIAWSRLVRRATLDEHRLRVVTASGREHAIERADIVVRGLGTAGQASSLARLHYPGGDLYLMQPPGVEVDLAEELSHPVADR
jgi:hypothetical protein